MAQKARRAASPARREAAAVAPTKASSVAAPRASSVTVASVALLLITLAAAVVVGFTSRQAWVAHLDEVRANATRDLDAVRAELGTATECCTAKRAEASARAAELHRTAAALTTQEAAALAASREAEAAHAAHREAAAAAACLLYTSPSPRDGLLSRMPSSA